MKFIYQMSSVILISTNKKQVQVLPTTTQWFGITHPQDKISVQEAFLKLPSPRNLPAKTLGELGLIQTTSRRNYQQLVDNFAFEGDFINIQPYGYGHINETFAVQFQKSNGKNHRYILQRINHKVFHNPAEVMHNYSVITNFLREKIVEAGGNPWRETINLIPAKNGQSFIQSDEGEFWRAEIFIEDAQTYQFPTRPNHLYNASWAFGNFGRLLNDFPVNQLFTTIPEFHHTPKRFQAFISALELDPHNRAGKVKNEIEFILNREFGHK